jgi:hypothetical protein
MKSLIRHLIPVATLALSTASPLFAQESIDIKPRWQVGKKFTQTMRMDQASTIALGDQKMEQKVGMTMDATVTVRAHENGKQKRVSVKYDRVAMSMNMAGQEMKYDSATPADAASDPLGMGKSFGAIVGKEIKMVMDEKDEVLEVENLDAMIQEMVAANPMAATIGQMFNKDAMKNMMRQSSLYASPGKPVKAGDSWPFKYNMPMPALGQIDLSGTYKLKGVGDHAGVKCAEITLDGKLVMDTGKAGDAKTDGSDPLKQLGVKIDGGKMTGTLWFDAALGICREAQFTQEMNLKMKNPQKPDESIEIPMKQTITQTVTKVENL